MAVENIFIGFDPQSGQLGENCYNFVGLQVVDEDVRHPEGVDELQTHGDQAVVAGLRGSELRLEVQSLLGPLHVEEGGEGDAVIFPVDHQHLVDINTDPDLVCLI